MNVVAYLRARDSHNQTREKALLEIQRKDIACWIEAHQNKLVACFEDIGSSASAPSPPAFRALIYAASYPNSGFDAVVVHSMARLVRGIDAFTTIERLLRESGVQLHFIGETQAIHWVAA